MSVVITGAGGFIGQVLAHYLLDHDLLKSLTLTDLTAPARPPASLCRSVEVRSIPLDLTDPASDLTPILPADLTAVFLLHGLMSSTTEANLDLGLAVNVDATRRLLDRLRATHAGVCVIFASSCAAHSLPLDGGPVRDTTLPRPTGSYGAQKLMVEVLLADYARRGLLDGRTVRLPTVVVRPGAPSGAASSFCSGLFREPLRGERAVLPVRRDLEVWVASTRGVVRNLARAMALGRVEWEKGGVVGLARTVNLPGITVTVAEMLEALEEVGGRDARRFVVEERDHAVEAIVESWATRFETQRALGLGMKEDATLVQMVREYVEDFGTVEKG